jgi:hypothetical protein
VLGVKNVGSYSVMRKNMLGPIFLGGNIVGSYSVRMENGLIL